jgi:hypothetical protein
MNARDSGNKKLDEAVERFKRSNSPALMKLKNSMANRRAYANVLSDLAFAMALMHTSNAVEELTPEEAKALLAEFSERFFTTVT